MKKLIFFFIFTFLLSWSMFIIALTLIPENELYRAPFITIGAFAPALVSILLSRRGKERETNYRKKRTLAFIVTWSIAFLNILLFSITIVTAQVLQLGITFTWLYNRTQGSLLSVALLHASWNTGGSFIPRTQVFFIIMSLVMVIFVFSDRMWKRV